MGDAGHHRDRRLHLLRLDALGDELEEPFGRGVNDLPLDALARIIERDIVAVIGGTDLPPLLQPVDDQLQ